MLHTTNGSTLFGTYSTQQNVVLSFLSCLYEQCKKASQIIKTEKIPDLFWDSSEYNVISYVQMCFNKALRDLTFGQQVNIEKIQCCFELSKNMNTFIITEVLRQLKIDLMKIYELSALNSESDNSCFQQISAEFVPIIKQIDMCIEAFVEKKSFQAKAVVDAMEHVKLILRCLAELEKLIIKDNPKILTLLMANVEFELRNLRLLSFNDYESSAEFMIEIGKILHNVHDLLVKNNTLLNISADFLSENLFKKVFAPDEMVKIDPYLKAFAVSCSEGCHP